MKARITSILVLLLVVTSIGCKENTALEYENAPALYFKYSKNDSEADYQRDSIAHTFFIQPSDQMRDTIIIQILTMGFPTTEDRPFVLEQINVGQPGAAVAGKHFVAFDDAEMIEHLMIPKGTVGKKFPLIVLRDPSLELEEVRLELKIGENQYFKRGIDSWTNFVVKTTAKAVKPTNWDTKWKYYFGATWGSVKMKFIIDNTGFTDFDGNTGLDSDYTNYLRSKVTQKLLEYNANPDNPDRPLREADGTLVEF